MIPTEWPAFTAGPPLAARSGPGPLLVLVEGYHDENFLLRIAAVLRHQPGVPNVAECERLGRLVFLPTGGDLKRWAYRLAPLGLPELHLYDREVSPLWDERRRLVAAIGQRPGCQALLTGKRAIENYLHADAIAEATGLTLAIDDEVDVPGVLARMMVTVQGGHWEELARRGRKRLRDRAKVLLNTTAVACMTGPRLQERDPQGEVVTWLRTIQQLIEPA